MRTTFIISGKSKRQYEFTIITDRFNVPDEPGIIVKSMKHLQDGQLMLYPVEIMLTESVDKDCSMYDLSNIHGIETGYNFAFFSGGSENGMTLSDIIKDILDNTPKNEKIRQRTLS